MSRSALPADAPERAIAARPPIAAAPRGLGGAVAGTAAALVTVAIWTAWIVGTRHAVGHAALPAAWLALLRYGVPALVLAPVWLRSGLLPRGVDPRLVLGMAAGAGAPFFAVVAVAMARAPAAEAGVLLPGTMPLFVALLAVVLFGERIVGLRRLGFALILAAILAIGFPALAGASADAALLLFPLGALMWAVFTLCFRASGLSALTATAVVAAWSALLALPFALASGVAPLVAAPPALLLGQVLVQGVLSGVVGTLAYGFAVGRLGAPRAAAFSSLSPAMAAIAGVPILGEVPSAPTLIGVACAVAGVALASGAFERRSGPA